MAGSRRLAKVGGGCQGGPGVHQWGQARQCPGVPNKPPYNAGAFRFELSFSPHHPLAPPRITFRTPIYHPAVDPEGRVCQPLTATEHWAPTTRVLHGGYRALGGGARPAPSRSRADAPPQFPQCSRTSCCWWTARTPSGCCGRTWPSSWPPTPSSSGARRRSTPASTASGALLPLPPKPPTTT
uniref:UBC core domain-containing protein n=1 Tax=Apteryx owenii TaxID=8824 RepID=A0A8B9PBJ8_APTOW